MLACLWVYAYTQGIGSAREVSRRMGFDPAFQWLAGMEVINYHTLADFRTRQGGVEEVFVQVLGVLSGEGLITPERVMHDGTKTRACASGKSFRGEARIHEHLAAARRHVEAMGEPLAEESVRERAARRAAAKERIKRLEAAAETLRGLQVGRSASEPAARVSETDPDARIMKNGDGGYAPAYNVQLYGSLPDHEGQADGQMRRQGISEAFYPQAFAYDASRDAYRCPAGQTLAYDGQELRTGVTHRSYRAAFQTYRACPCKAQCCPANASRGRRITRKIEDPRVTAFREKMQTEAAKRIYRTRSPIAEFPNAWIKSKIGLRQFRVRGLSKATAEAIRAALTYNVQQWIRLRWRDARGVEQVA